MCANLVNWYSAWSRVEFVLNFVSVFLVPAFTFPTGLCEATTTGFGRLSRRTFRFAASNATFPQFMPNKGSCLRSVIPGEKKKKSFKCLPYTAGL